MILYVALSLSEIVAINIFKINCQTDLSNLFSRKIFIEFYFFWTLCKLSNKMFFDKHHWKLGQVYCLYYINNPAKQRAACSIKFNKIFSWKCMNKFDRYVCQFILKRLISIILESELCNKFTKQKNSKSIKIYRVVHIQQYLYTGNAHFKNSQNNAWMPRIIVSYKVKVWNLNENIILCGIL